MLRILQRSRAPTRRAAPEGRRLYAVGDVHGRLDALDTLLAALRLDIARGGVTPVLIMLGDYVDRGADSRGVIDRLIELERDTGIETRFIRGNHDDTMVRFATDRSVGPSWCDFGGTDTLQSYGVTAPAINEGQSAWARAQAAFSAALPADHLRFLRALEPFVEYGDYFFTHAGVRPGIELDAQDSHDLMWIRDEFLRDTTPFRKTIVHGHTPEEQVFFDDRRIGIDTGAYATGRLTAVVLEGGERRLIQAQVSGAGAMVHHFKIDRLPATSSRHRQRHRT